MGLEGKEDKTQKMARFVRKHQPVDYNQIRPIYNKVLIRI